MSKVKTLQSGECYKMEDELFTITMRIMVKHPTPNVWHRTARRSVVTRIKHALLGHSAKLPSQHIPQNQTTTPDVISLARWLI